MITSKTMLNNSDDGENSVLFLILMEMTFVFLHLL